MGVILANMYMILFAMLRQLSSFYHRLFRSKTRIALVSTRRYELVLFISTYTSSRELSCCWSTYRDSVTEGDGGRVPPSPPPPSFGRSVNLNQRGQGKTFPSYYQSPPSPQIFRPAAIPDLFLLSKDNFYFFVLLKITQISAAIALASY